MIPVEVPIKITRCLSVTAKTTEVIRMLGYVIAALIVIGTIPEILSPTSQKFNMLPVD